MDRAQKEAFIQGFNSAISDAGSVVVAHYRGLTVEQMEGLRKEIRANDAKFQVVKNRLAKRAFEGTPYTVLGEFMTGPTAVAYSSDPVAAAKVVHEFAKDNDNLIIVGGALGEKKLSAEEVKALASMPSLDELRAKLLGLISAPATRIAQYTQEPAAKVARVVAARGQQAA